MKRFVLFGAILLICVVGVTSQATAATLYSQSNILRGPDTGLNCSGANHGKCTVAEVGSVGTSPTQADNVKVTCLLKNGPHSASLPVYWVCTNVARGCHDDACGFITLGTLLTDSVGKGKLVVTKGNNPYPGKYVHIDMGVSTVYASVFAGIPIGVGPAEVPAGAQAGDPMKQ